MHFSINGKKYNINIECISCEQFIYNGEPHICAIDVCPTIYIPKEDIQGIINILNRRGNHNGTRQIRARNKS